MNLKCLKFKKKKCEGRKEIKKKKQWEGRKEIVDGKTCS